MIRLDVMTLNLMAAGVPMTGYRDWAGRRSICADILPAIGADIIALQECIHDQQPDMAAALGDFDFVSSDMSGAPAHEKAAFEARSGLRWPDRGEMITFWRRARFDLRERREAWLSPTPGRISVGFGNVSPRALLAVRLLDRRDGREWWVANTHLDLRCPEPMARVAAQVLDEWIAPGMPALFCGDFNSGLSTPVAQVLRDAGWSAPVSSRDTYRGERVDHVWRRGPGLRLLYCAVIESRAYEPMLSDHDPVVARFELDG
jgi:endonuclease/exonuclease/phosphatase family metal-dependent hydrolase